MVDRTTPFRYDYDAFCDTCRRVTTHRFGSCGEEHPAPVEAPRRPTQMVPPAAPVDRTEDA